MPVIRKAKEEDGLPEIHRSDLCQAREAETRRELLHHRGFVSPLTAQGKSRTFCFPQQQGDWP